MDSTWRVLIVGAGRCGVEIALQCAVFGVQVALFDTDRRRLEELEGQLPSLLGSWVRAGWLSPESVDSAAENVRLCADAPEAASGAQLLIESVTEDLEIKRAVFRQFSPLCPSDTLFATNSSYFLPSSLAKATARPAQFAAIHFHVPVWHANVVDVMPHPKSSPQTLERMCAFARSIGQTPIQLRRESFGYVYNAILLPMLMEAINLAERDVADVFDIDRAWMGIMKTPVGPFGVLDNIGIDTAHGIATYWGKVLRDKKSQRCAEFLRPYVEQKNLGVKTGQGFYEYPHPAFERTDFLPATSSPTTADGEMSSPDDVAKSSTATTFRRFYLRLSPSQLHPRAKTKPAFHGPALIVGGESWAAALKSELEQAGCPSSVTVPWNADLEARLDESTAPPHLFLLPDSERGPQFSAEQLSHRMMTLFRIVRSWFARLVNADRLDVASVSAVVHMGGDFGLSGQVLDAGAGGVAGLLKGVFMEGAASESLGPQVKIVDISNESSPAEASRWLLNEFALSQKSVAMGTFDEYRQRHSQMEVCYPSGARNVLRLEEQSDDAFPSPDVFGHWLLTGGARGITAVVAKTLARHKSVSLHLVGRTAQPDEDYASLSETELQELRHDVMRRAYAARQRPDEQWRRVSAQIELQKNLREIKELGASVNYHSADVCDPVQLAEVLAEVRRAGSLRGVVHGAGVEITGALTRKDDDAVRATMAAKVTGTLNLMQATESDPLEYFIAFGSLSGRFGGVAQAEYSMANELQAKLVAAQRARRPSCHSVLFHWPGWDEVGMASRSTSRYRLLQSGHRLLDPESGVYLLMQELAARGPAEVVIADPREVPDAWKFPM